MLSNLSLAAQIVIYLFVLYRFLRNFRRPALAWLLSLRPVDFVIPVVVLQIFLLIHLVVSRVDGLPLMAIVDYCIVMLVAVRASAQKDRTAHWVGD
jgi:hypothetical protein